MPRMALVDPNEKRTGVVEALLLETSMTEGPVVGNELKSFHLRPLV
jgi:hypothetical protein